VHFFYAHAANSRPDQTPSSSPFSLQSPPIVAQRDYMETVVGPRWLADGVEHRNMTPFMFFFDLDLGKIFLSPLLGFLPFNLFNVILLMDGSVSL
jgi:hypothetical protein